MQLAAPFCVGMLGWYAWYETGKKFWLVRSVLFWGIRHAGERTRGAVYGAGDHCGVPGAATGTVGAQADDLAPGCGAYTSLMVLPWFIAVQRRNPQFFREFFIQHNLERYATNLYAAPSALVLLRGCAGVWR